MIQPTAKRRKLLETDVDHDSSSSDLDNAEVVNGKADEAPSMAPKEASSTISVAGQRKVSNPKTSRIHQRLELGTGAVLSKTQHKSNLFKMQMDELLHEVRLRDKSQLGEIDKFLRTIKNAIEAISDQPEKSISAAEEQLKTSHGIAIPFPEPRPGKDVKYGLAYAKPTNINIVGGYALKTASRVNGRISIDMAVTMPPELFQEKDYLNHRYFYKRAYYLACVAAGLQGHKERSFKMEYRYLNDNTLHPILSLVPGTGGVQDKISSLQCVVNIIPIVAAQTFPMSKLLPTMNCVRYLDAADNKDTRSTLSTPFYNASLQSDCSVTAYLRVLHDASNQCEGFKDACLLGRLWLRQRNISSSVVEGGFGCFEWSTLMAILLLTGGPKAKPWLLPAYSSYQLFKRTLEYLSSTDLIKSPLLYRSTGLTSMKSDVPVVYDGERGLNVLYKMTPWSYRKLCMEADTTLKMLNDTVFDYFEASFIMKLSRSLENWDMIARFPVTTLPNNSPDQESYAMRQSRKMFELLSRGLGDRIKLIYLSWPALSNWPLTAAHPLPSSESTIEVGLKLDPENACRTVDHGPLAEFEKEAARFRQFWGDKAELRRFKDGSISESLNWSGLKKNMSVVETIMRHLLDRHINSDMSKSALFSSDLSKTQLPGGISNSLQPSLLFEHLTSDYDRLEKVMRELEGLPLQIRQVFPADSSLRYASVQPSVSSHRRSQIAPMNVVLQFEGSGRWPDDLEAIQRTKIAFLLKLGEVLEPSTKDTITRLGLENERYSTLNNAFLDVTLASQTTFRLRIQCEREQTLNERKLKDKEIDGRSRDEAVLALAAYKRDFVRSPAHTQTVRILCTRHAALSPTIRLVKLWYDSNLLSLHFSEEFIELVCIRTFLQPYPWQTPSSATTGFLRTLRFLSRWDWRVDPLIVDVNGEMTLEDVETINTKFAAWRKIDPLMQRLVLFAASNLDMDGITWTQGIPSKVVATRMTTLARSACAVVKDSDLQSDLSLLFIPSLENYNFIIHLNPRFTEGRRGEKPKQQEFKNLQTTSGTDTEFIGYDPIRLFIEELSTLYSSTFLLFHNSQGGNVICGIWSPHTGPRSWKVNLTYSTQPVTAAAEKGEASELDINKAAILNEVARLGGDMVSRIELR